MYFHGSHHVNIHKLGRLGIVELTALSKFQSFYYRENTIIIISEMKTEMHKWSVSSQEEGAAKMHSKRESWYVQVEND